MGQPANLAFTIAFGKIQQSTSGFIFTQYRVPDPLPYHLQACIGIVTFQEAANELSMKSRKKGRDCPTTSA